MHHKHIKIQDISCKTNFLYNNHHFIWWLLSLKLLTFLKPLADVPQKQKIRRQKTRLHEQSHSRCSFVTPCLALQTTEDWARKSWTNQIVQSFFFRPITTKVHVHNFSIQSDSYRLSVVTDFHYIFFVS